MKKWKRDLLKLSVPLLLVGTILLLSAFTINGGAPGSTAAMTPLSPGTATPIAVATCAASRTNFRIDSKGTANCYIAPASLSSPCAVASPAPNAGTMAGEWIQPNSSWILSAAPGYISAGIAGSEWDIVCDAAGQKIFFIDLP